MARVTVEDCLEHVENRFKLVLLASKRARQLTLGTEPLVAWENDKPTVVALREIEQGLVSEETMQSPLSELTEAPTDADEDDLVTALYAEISRELEQTAEPPVASQSQPESSSASGEVLFDELLDTDAKEASSMTDLPPENPFDDAPPAPPAEASSAGEPGS